VWRSLLHFLISEALIRGCLLSPEQAFQRRGDRSGALVMFDDALRRAPDNALVRYHRAKLFIGMKQYQVSRSRGPLSRVAVIAHSCAGSRVTRSSLIPVADGYASFPLLRVSPAILVAFILRCASSQRAVYDLERLRDAAPEEANVIFQLARVYRLLGDELKSAQLLAAARDVAPKSIGKIRKLLETVRDEDAADEEMDEG
jgi:predicted Zn-dependent protease